MIPLLLFVVGPVVDLILLVRFGQAFGFLSTVGLVLGTAVLGIATLRARRFPAAARFGGLLLVLPGPITDGIGLALLFPPTRMLLAALGRRWLKRALRSGRFKVSFMRFGGGMPWDPGTPPSDPPLGLDPDKQILVPPPQGGGHRGAR